MRKKEVIYPVSFLDEREREPRPKDYHLFPNGHKRVSTQSIAIPYIYIFLLEREELLLLAHAYYIILCQWYGQAVFLTFDDIFLAGWLVDSVYNTNTRPPGLPYIQYELLYMSFCSDFLSATLKSLSSYSGQQLLAPNDNFLLRNHDHHPSNCESYLFIVRHNLSTKKG